MFHRSPRPAFVRHPRAHAALLALGVAASGALQAQQAADAPQRVEITGSSIKRIDGETALPVQILSREEIERAAVTTAAELLSKISANSAGLTDGASFSDIAGQRGFNGANLRGIGVSSTLVLLNGRRLANFASPGGNAGVDLNAIPAAAIARVEVLKDGASAIYGTDAIGGVINFITKTDYRGGDVSVYTNVTEHGGAGKSIVTLAGGTGDLERDRFNLFGVFDYQKSQALRSTQRSWIGSAYQPDINLDVSSSNTYPANVRPIDPDTGRPYGPRLNPSAPTCNPPFTVYAPDSFVGDKACLYDYMHDTEIFPASERLSLMARGQFAVDRDHTLFAEVLSARTTTNYRISPPTITNLNYPGDGLYYPTTLDVSGPLRVNMRLREAGGRDNDVTADAQRLLLGAKGTVQGWDYDSALNHSVNHVTDAYVGGYVRTSVFDPAFESGIINPFGPSGAEGKAAIAAALINDKARVSRGTTDSFDLKLTHELFDLAGGSAAIAFGGELRRETMKFTPSALLAAGEIRGEGEASPFSGSRTVSAAYTELDLPFTKTLEGQVALRYDHYSDVGSTVNPKLGLRWAPAKEMVLRGSYSTGFRAPSLPDLYSPTRIGQTNGIYDDKLGCKVIGNIDNTDNPDYCGLQPDKLVGGSAGLKPEKSKQLSFGLVLAPTRDITATADYWRIQKTDVIAAPEGVYFNDPVHYAPYITRGEPDPNLPGFPGPITQIDSRLRNIGALDTSGVDLGIDWRLPATEFGKFDLSLNSTWVIGYKTREDSSSPQQNGVGRFLNDQVVQRWRHTLALNYDQGPWAATLSQTFYLGYLDQNPMPDGSPRHVGNYALWDLSTSYEASKAIKLRVGVKNVFDTAPPRSNQIYSFIAGYDPNYTDPRGRSFFASMNYSFR